jgi:hypothetical protein
MTLQVHIFASVHGTACCEEKTLPFDSVKQYLLISSLYVCMAIKYIIVLFVETPRKFITAKDKLIIIKNN